jgi:hypothetical protein
MFRAMSSGWACMDCGARRTRTVIIDDAPAMDFSPARGFSTACPACGHVELVIPSESRERVIAVRYSVA